MAKKQTILGVDIGHDQLKLALVRGDEIQMTISASMPENLMKQVMQKVREDCAVVIDTMVPRHNDIEAVR